MLPSVFRGGLICDCLTTRGLARPPASAPNIKKCPDGSIISENQVCSPARQPAAAPTCPSSCAHGCEAGTNTCKPAPAPEPAPKPSPANPPSSSSGKVIDSWVLPTCIYSKMPKILEVCDGKYLCTGDVVCVIDGIAEKLHGVHCPAHKKRKCPSSADKCVDTLEWTLEDSRKPQNFRSIMGRNKKYVDILFGGEGDSNKGGETFFGGSTAGQSGETFFGGSTAGQGGETFFGGSTSDPAADAGATDAGATDAGAQQ